MPKFSLVKKILTIFVLVLFVIFVGLILFIKLDTPVAAEFTDNYLRPLLGNRKVIFLEKIFYNAEDKFTQITNKGGVAPQFK